MPELVNGAIKGLNAYYEAQDKVLIEWFHLPEKFFKAVMSLKPGKEKAIAFIFTNDDKNPSYRKLATSVDAVEKLTGFDFFCMTDDSIEKKIEQQCDIDDWK